MVHSTMHIASLPNENAGRTRSIVDPIRSTVDLLNYIASRVNAAAARARITVDLKGATVDLASLDAHREEHTVGPVNRYVGRARDTPRHIHATVDPMEHTVDPTQHTVDPTQHTVDRTEHMVAPTQHTVDRTEHASIAWPTWRILLLTLPPAPATALPSLRPISLRRKIAPSAQEALSSY